MPKIVFRWSYGHVLVMVFSSAALVSLFVLALVFAYLKLELPDVSSLKNYRPPAVSELYDRKGRLVAYFYREKRWPVPLELVPERLIQAIIAAEDARFYQHKGLDFFSIMRAAIRNMEAGSIVQGGSTITQQVTRALLLSREKSFRRKIKEALLAWRIDSMLTKDEILNIYLNQIYLGEGAYGVEAASRIYFGKHVWDLNLAECALIAGLPQAPSRYNPYRNFKLAKKRQAYVLKRMVAEGYITEEEAQRAYATPIELRRFNPPIAKEAAYFVDYAQQQLSRILGREELLTGGYRIYSTLDLDYQRAAFEALKEGLIAIDKRHPDLKDSPVQGAICLIEASTGAIRALVGGLDPGRGHFNRATQARRQPGSAFKPIVYAAALEADLISPATLFVDEPLIFPGATEDKHWEPQNFDGFFLGPITVRKALADSRNTVAVKVAQLAGIDQVITEAQKLGITVRLSRDLALALGSNGIPLIQLTAAYQAFANEGERIPPRIVEALVDRDGRVLEPRRSPPVRVLSPETSFMLTYLLEEVVKDGTGRCASRLPIPIAAKTGTTDYYRDAWFVGYTPSLVIGVWVGRDDKTPLGPGETGGRAACPIWVSFMEKILDIDGLREERFIPPEGITFAAIDETTGEVSLPKGNTVWMPLREGEVSEIRPVLEERPSLWPDVSPQRRPWWQRLPFWE
ncbi:penicillin-binding protein 1A [Thermosulfuriphilus sp.]